MGKKQPKKPRKAAKITADRAKTYCQLIKMGSSPAEAARATWVSPTRWRSAEARKVTIPDWYGQGKPATFAEALADAEDVAAGKLALKMRAGILAGVERGDPTCMKWANENMLGESRLRDPDAPFSTASTTGKGSIKEQARAAMPRVMDVLNKLLHGNSAIAAMQAAQAIEKLADLGSVTEVIPPLVFGDALAKHEAEMKNGLKELA